jgi:hypothetical protein
MIYLSDNKKFSFSYQEMREDYHKIKLYTDDEFVENLDEVLHFTIFTGFIKEWPASMALCDTCLIHELVHLKQGETVQTLEEIRELFDKICEFN